MDTCCSSQLSTTRQRERHSTNHYNDVIMDAMASQITSVPIVYPTGCSGTEQRKHQSSASLAFVRGIHRVPMNSSHKRPVTPHHVRSELAHSPCFSLTCKVYLLWEQTPAKYGECTAHTFYHARLHAVVIHDISVGIQCSHCRLIAHAVDALSFLCRLKRGPPTLSNNRCVVYRPSAILLSRHCLPEVPYGDWHFVG